MDKKILIMKTGSTVASLLEMGEDFEDWFISAAGGSGDEFEVCCLHLGQVLPELESVAGIIITGSAAYVTELEAWNYIGADYLRDAHRQAIPILGVCYGHQLIAWAFEGGVDFHPAGREIGTVQIELAEAAAEDALLQRLPPIFNAQTSHQQTVTRLPATAVLLASNEFEAHHAYRLGNTTWGLQFHPEFSDRVIRVYIEERRDAIVAEGLDPQALLARVKPTPESASLIKRFIEIAQARTPA